MLLKLILENYVPLISAGIHRVELSSVDMVNLFVSVNGSGKSSVLKELHPFPPENGNYKEGRKYSLWRINRKTYELDGYTGLGNGHSFKVDGKELNTGGTFTVQKELCDNHFNLDLNMVKVLNGIRIVDRFSAMTANRRKEVIMSVYPNDTTYALGVFNRLRSERNELKAAIKNQVSRYAEEKNKLSFINETGVEQLEENIRNLERRLKESLLIRGSLEGVDRDPFLDRKVEEFTVLSEKLLVNKLSGFNDTLEELQGKVILQEKLLNIHENNASLIRGMITENASGLEGLEEFLKNPQVYTQQEEILKDDLERVETELGSISIGLKNHELFNENQGLKGLDVIAGMFSEYLRRVVPASSGELTSVGYRKFLTDLDVLQSTIRERERKLQDYTHKLKHYESAELVECPDCNNKFKVGISKEDIHSLKEQIESLKVGLERFKTQEKNLNDKIENDSEWYNTMNSLFSFIRENSHVRVLPELVKEYNVGKEHSETLCNLLNLFSKRCKLEARKKALDQEKRLLDARIDLLNRNNLIDAAFYVESLENELAEENTLIYNSKQTLQQLKWSVREINSYNSDLLKLETLKREIFKGFEDNGKVDLRRIVDKQVSALQADKDETLSSIIKSRSLSAVVQSIEDDVNRLKRRLTIVETYMDGLCPNKGLIGKLMTDFISTVCGNINFVLSQIWDSPLFIKPCNKTNGDLTYKFPVSKGVGDPAPDISECSAGEMDVIDWAFRFVLLNYTSFPFPLIMDEVGPFLDDIKRGRFFKFVKEYTEEENSRQLFLVSHYLGERNMFKDANFIGLRYEGLSLPGVMNEQTKVS